MQAKGHGMGPDVGYDPDGAQAAIKLIKDQTAKAFKCVHNVKSRRAEKDLKAAERRTFKALVGRLPSATEQDELNK